MDLPPWLRWWELDSPRLLAFKEDRLRFAKPRCYVKRISIDLRDAPARNRLFDELAPQTGRALVLTEGVLAYLQANDVTALAGELHARKEFRLWAADLVAHTLLAVAHRSKVGRALEKAGARLQFAPQEGVEFFEPLGWRAVDHRNPILEGFRLRRLPWFMSLWKPLLLRPAKPGSHMAAWAKAGLVLLSRHE